MKSIFLFGALALSATAARAEMISVAEVCEAEGPCAFRIPFPGLEAQGVYIVTAENADAVRRALPNEHLFIATEDEYQAAKGQFQGNYDLESMAVAARRNPPAPRPTPTPAPGAGGPLVTGSISIGNITIGGGGDNCRGCHGNPHQKYHD